MNEAWEKLREASNRIREEAMVKVYVNMKDVQEAAAQLIEQFEEAIQALENCFAEIYPAVLDELKEKACDCGEDRYDLEYQRYWEREALLHDQAKARARYMAHCAVMAAHKSRQQLRRRKYRGGANAGWY